MSHQPDPTEEEGPQCSEDDKDTHQYQGDQDNARIETENVARELPPKFRLVVQFMSHVLTSITTIDLRILSRLPWTSLVNIRPRTRGMNDMAVNLDPISSVTAQQKALSDGNVLPRIEIVLLT